jgi:ComEC/Rec2-related protein
MPSIYFYLTGIACGGGILFRTIFDIGVSGIALSFLIGVACFMAGILRGSSTPSVLYMVAIVGIFSALGMARLEYEEKRVSPYTALEGEKVVLEVRIVQEPEEREMMTHLYVKPIDQNVGTERLLITADRFSIENQEIQYGDHVQIEGTLKKPKPFMTDTGREFDYVGFLRSKGVQYTMSFAEVTLVTHEETAIGKLFVGKEAFLSALEIAIPPPASGLGAGILLGVKRALGEHLDSVFREVGIIHIVVLSGYNIMIVIEVFSYLLALVFFPKTRMFLGILGIVIFAILVGFSATVVRASLMAILLLVARGTGNTYAVLRALTFAGVIMLMHQPYLLVHDPGFQLSFLATLGLILFSPLIAERLPFVPEKFGVRGLVTATLGTQIIVLPLLLYHTGTVSLIGVIANLLVLPMVPTAMILTFVTGVAGLLSDAFGIVVGYGTYLSLQYIIVVAEICARIPLASVTFAQFPLWGMVCAYACIVWAYIRLEKRMENQRIQDEHTTIVNEYEGWVIEEEMETKIQNKKPEEALRASSGPVSKFPFR